MTITSAESLFLNCRRAPRKLFPGIKTPDNNITLPTPVIVPGSVEGAPAFRVRGAAQKSLEGRFELREEDEVVGPFVGLVLVLLELLLTTGVLGVEREVGWFMGDVAEAAEHVVAEELEGVCVELVCFVDVSGFFGVVEVDGGFAGEGPGGD